MLRTSRDRVVPILLLFVMALPVTAVEARAADQGRVKGTFVVGGVDAGLKHVRAGRVKLDEKGAMGYAALLSARPAEGELERWQTADPAEKGSFIYVVFEPNGAIWIAELGHAKAKSGRFGVIMEVKVESFKVTGDRLSAHVRTVREQEFTQDKFSLDLTFEAPLEKR
ncbi:MAG TPA: hypothetical protein VG477_19205 [Thermoanaerobaculia bacterium]|nr:hypothetical protein [Thermoanaerobaculia bacterium]